MNSLKILQIKKIKTIYGHTLMNKLIPILLMIFCVSNTYAESAPKDTEQLRFHVPKGFKVAYKNANKSQSILEIIEKSESLKNWTRMITIQTFKDGKDYQPEKFILDMANLAKKQCGNVQVVPVKTGEQNGYAFVQKIILCNPNKQTNKSELMNIKAIKGNDLFYVAQVATRVNIDRNEMRKWGMYLRNTVVISK